MPSSAGQGASASTLSRSEFAQSSSVMNGMKGCSSFTDLIEHEGGRRLRLGLGGFVRALQERLGQLQIPVAENVPDEAIGGIRRVVKAIGFDRRRHFGNCFRRLADDPLVERDFYAARVEARRCAHSH